jgi:hypothetical protein
MQKASSLPITPGRAQPADYRGKVVTLFFGYTQCPDVCPTNLLGMAEVMRQLGPDAEKVQVLFITVDPERDTQALLAEYVPAFDKRFAGLYGDVPRRPPWPGTSRSSIRSRETPRVWPTRLIIPLARMCSIRRGACAFT